MSELKDVLDIANGVLAKYHIEPITAEEVEQEVTKALTPSPDNSAQAQCRFDALWARIQKQEKEKGQRKPGTSPTK